MSQEQTISFEEAVQQEITRQQNEYNDKVGKATLKAEQDWEIKVAEHDKKQQELVEENPEYVPIVLTAEEKRVHLEKYIIDIKQPDSREQIVSSLLNKSNQEK